MRRIQIVRPGIGAATQPFDDDEHGLALVRALSAIVPLDAVWTVVQADTRALVDLELKEHAT